MYRVKDKDVTPFTVKPIQPMSEKKVEPFIPIPAMSASQSSSSTVVRKKYEMCKNFREKG
jgi:hypothetical protein